jgi:uncharacterized protein YecA (UPF0149 family)
MAKLGRNEPCHCGSGKKYKHCHESKTSEGLTSRVLMIVVGGAVLAAIAAGVASFTAERPVGTRVWDPAHGHFHDANGVQVP